MFCKLKKKKDKFTHSPLNSHSSQQQYHARLHMDVQTQGDQHACNIDRNDFAILVKQNRIYEHISPTLYILKNKTTAMLAAL